MSKSELLKKLRNITLAGFMDCKKALEANNDDLDAAIKWLREKGISKAAAKNSEKVATEGTTWAASDSEGAALLELNAQTDFTGKSELVLNLASEIINLVLKQKTNDLTTVLNAQLSDGSTVNDACLSASAKTGEKIELRRILYLPLQPNQSVAVYRHDNGKISTLVLLEGQVEHDKIKGLAMHVTAMNPKFLSSDQVDSEWLAQERKFIEKQILDEGKPLEFADKIIEGRVRKVLSEVCFLDQEYILVPKQSVDEYIKSLNLKPLAMHRFELGEGVEKVAVDFASEVKAQMR